MIIKTNRGSDVKKAFKNTLTAKYFEKETKQTQNTDENSEQVVSESQTETDSCEKFCLRLNVSECSEKDN